MSEHVKKGTYFFPASFLFIIFFFPRGILFVTLTAALVIYEIFKGAIDDILKRMRLNYVIEKLTIPAIKSRGKLNRSVTIILLLTVLFVLAKLHVAHEIKLYAKSLIKGGTVIDVPSKAKEKKLAYRNVIGFINENILGKPLFLFPFLEWEFFVYTHHDGFISSYSPTLSLFYNNESSNKIKHILEKDLNFPPEKLFENWDGKNMYARWGEMWKNIDEKMVIKWKEQYNMTHVIREKNLPLDFPELYQNDFYVVYKIN